MGFALLAIEMDLTLMKGSERAAAVEQKASMSATVLTSGAQPNELLC